MNIEAELPDNYRSALADDVPEGRACGNCMFYNEERLNEAGDMAYCEQWNDFVMGGNYCNAWAAKEADAEHDDEDDDDKPRYSNELIESSRPMILTFSQDVLSCNKSKRELTGVIVPFGKIGQTNMGEVMFEAGSLEISEGIKLFTEHDMTQPIGRMIEHNVTPIGVVARFKIAQTTAGNDALVLASEDLRGAFSIGAKINASEPDGNVLVIKSAKLIEVSHVSSPAFVEAVITDVAASADNQTNTTEREQDMENVKTSEVEAAPKAVEASQQDVKPVAYAKPRVNTDLSAGQFLKVQMQANNGDASARDIIAAIAEQTSVTDAGLVPPTHLREVIGIVDGSRPFWDSLQSGVLPASGLKFFKPRRKVLATTAVTAEGAEFGSTETEIDNIEVDIIKIAGANKVSVELIDRSDPAYLDELVRQLAADWSRKSDVYCASIALGAPVDSTGVDLYTATAQGIADSFGVQRSTPNNFLADIGNFADILKAVDGNDRPLFAAAAIQNAAGQVTQGSTNGTIAGLRLVVDPNFDTGSGVEGFVYPTEAATVYQSPAFQLRADLVANGEIEIGIYGYVAVSANYPSAVRAIKISA